MSKELFIKLSEELGREPTDDEMTDAFAAQIDNAMNYRDEIPGAFGITGVSIIAKSKEDKDNKHTNDPS